MVEEYPDISVSGLSDGDDVVVAVTMVMVVVVVVGVMLEDRVPSDQGPCRNIARQLVENYSDVSVSICGDGDDGVVAVAMVVGLVVLVMVVEANVPTDQGPYRDICWRSALTSS